MTSAAEKNGRDPLYAQAMADPSIDLPEYRAGEGDFLTLRAQEALEVEYAEGLHLIVKSYLSRWKSLNQVSQKQVQHSLRI